ncbi:protein MEI2-like 2 [Diospyros lotus]|uniref:protein MEI2-like 2 n=1 Tax=Diospyros lotus TaxID=55363 RepID=UPI00225542FC|nr:protein MEI2-like 2 [Diospyros lotus]
MLSPSHIILFYETFNGKKWEKFNSEKVASLAYARIQGQAALIAHFQNSSLMNEDKRCRPILFHSEGSEAGDQIIQEHLPLNGSSIHVRQPNGSHSDDSPGSPLKGSPDEKPDKS